MTAGWVTYERKKLYEEVWAEPLRDVAQRYEVSDVALGKICRKLVIPLPGRGYWAKVKAGKAPKTPALSPPPAGVHATFSSYRSHSASRSARPVPAETDERVSREKTPEARIVVSAELQDPHELVATAAKLLEARKPVGGFVFSKGRRCLDLKVSPDSLDRALRIMDSLLRALEVRGLQVEVTPVPRPPKSGQQPAPDADKDANVTRVLVDDEWIPIGIREELDVIRYPDPEPPKGLEGYDLYYWMRRHRKEPDYVLAGHLALFINTENLGVRRTWRDAQTQRVENCLNAFVAHLYMTALAIKEERIAAERRRLERIEEQRLWAEEQTRRQEAERRRRIEERRQKALDAHLERWQRSRDVRSFLSDAHSVLTKAGLPPEETKGVQAWLAWVETYAARLDPLVDLPGTAAQWEKATDEPIRRW